MISKNIIWNSYRINRKDRENLHKHRSAVLWFTGLSGSGKSTLASILEEQLHYKKISTYVLDGDNIRHGLCNDLSFNSFDRSENIRRAGEVVKLMFDAGLVVLVAFIAPYRKDRQMIKNMFSRDSFLEVFVDTPIRICKSRDPKGLYRKFESGQIKNLSGVDSVYEIPLNPDIHLDGKKEISILSEQLFNAAVSIIFSKNF